MSMGDYEQAKELIIKSQGISTFVGPRSEALVNLAQDRLSVKFPETYRRFLLEFGAGGIGFFEIYGVIDEDFGNMGIPNVVSLTIEGRKEWNLPPFLLPIYELGDGEFYCLDLQEQEGDEAKVVGFTPGYSSEEQKLDIVADGFGKLFLDLIQLELKIRKV